MEKEDPKVNTDESQKVPIAEDRKAHAQRVATDEEKVATARVKAAMAGDLKVPTADDRKAHAQKVVTQEGPKAATAAGQKAHAPKDPTADDRKAHAQKVRTDEDQKVHVPKVAMEDALKAGRQKDAKAAMDEGLRAAIAGQKEPEATAMTEGRQKEDMTDAQTIAGQAQLCARNSCTSHACQCRKH